MSSSTLAPPSTGSRLAAEAIGTFVLVFGGLGTAVFAAGFVFRPLLGRSAQVTRIAGA